MNDKARKWDEQVPVVSCVFLQCNMCQPCANGMFTYLQSWDSNKVSDQYFHSAHSCLAWINQQDQLVLINRSWVRFQALPQKSSLVNNYLYGWETWSLTPNSVQATNVHIWKRKLDHEEGQNKILMLFNYGYDGKFWVSSTERKTKKFFRKWDQTSR